MSVKDSKTEQLIKNTAKRIFLSEGKMLATTQDIADAAGVNRSLLHYYFRSRDVLFDQVFKEALVKLRERLLSIMVSKDLFRSKIESFINIFFEELTDVPYLEAFIILQLNKDASKYEEFFTSFSGHEEKNANFLAEIKLEMDKGTIPEMKPLQFFINLFSLMAYPFAAKTLYEKMFNLDEQEYTNLMNERKKLILSLLFKK